MEAPEDNKIEIVDADTDFKVGKPRNLVAKIKSMSATNGSVGRGSLTPGRWAARAATGAISVFWKSKQMT